MRLLAALLGAAAVWAAAPAQAGTYTVYACTAAGHKRGNRSWTAQPAKVVVTDPECDTGAPIASASDAGTTVASGALHVRYRFRDSASRGHTFVFRARIRPGPRFPYETGYSNRVTVRVA